ncbi:helix-turn-helix domain-containing protein [Haloparvum sp. PAK95]|uniref:helix-turn-helix domain-containing protein n=1 Tax=Haloparvum sp. PAK95 TaxID=3418962 RepID=UPI003D2EF7B0
MTVLVELTAPAESVAMAETLLAAPETVVEIERVVGHPTELVTPYFWSHGGGDGEFETALSRDSTIEAYDQLDVFAEETLYRAEWDPTMEAIPYVALENDATILEAAGQDGEWEIRLRFEDDSKVSAFSTGCTSRDLSYEVGRVYHPKQPTESGGIGVTPKQREALQAALERGYYEIPPETTMTEIADELDVSQQSLSRRLRRAHGNLASNALTVPEPIPSP